MRCSDAELAFVLLERTRPVAKDAVQSLPGSVTLFFREAAFDHEGQPAQPTIIMESTISINAGSRSDGLAQASMTPCEKYSNAIKAPTSSARPASTLATSSGSANQISAKEIAADLLISVGGDHHPYQATCNAASAHNAITAIRWETLTQLP